MVGKTGRSLTVTVDGKRMVFRGEPAVPAVLQVNDEEASLSAVVHAGDHIRFVPARHGQAASRTLSELLGPGFYGQAMVNNAPAPMDTQLRQGDVVLTLRQTPSSAQRQEAVRPNAPQAAPVKPVVQGREVHITLNGEPLALPAKDGGAPYYLMDLLEYSGIDFEHLDRNVRLEVNGVEQGFQYALREQDSVLITVA